MKEELYRGQTQRLAAQLVRGLGQFERRPAGAPGPQGVGKTTLARIFAKALNCRQGPAEKPCNQCPVCRQITQGAAVDVVERPKQRSPRPKAADDLYESCLSP